MAKQRVLVVGADGVIGRHVCEALTGRYDLIRAGLNGPDLLIDLSDPQSLVSGLTSLGAVDAVISTAGRANFSPLSRVHPAGIEESTYGLGLKDKLLGQVNLALASQSILRAGGSITLTSGTTSQDPIIGGSSLSMVNGALEHWVRAAATELRAFRLNIVSPSLVEGTPAAAIAAFPGFEVIPGRKIALAYIRCLESGLSGEVIRA